jgi:curved DNA-binding protein CbpA
MRSAYLVLGVPGNATPEEIESAFRKAEAQFPRERLAEEEGALARFHDIRDAYKVLRDPEARAAHDRKLQGATGTQPRVRTVVVSEPSSSGRNIFLLLAAILFAAGAFQYWRTVEARKEQAAMQLAAQKAAADAAERKRQDDERQAALRDQQARESEANEQRLRMESQQADYRAQAAMRAQEISATNARRQELYEQQRQESARQNEERRAAAEARMRTERDKARVRELCWQNYHRGDC